MKNACIIEMKNLKIILAAILSAALIFLNADVLIAEESRDIPVWEVPRGIISAAEDAMPGIRILSARIIETEDGGENYEIEGVKDQKVYRIQIDEGNSVLKNAPVDRVINNVSINSLPNNVVAAAKDEIKDFKILNAYMVIADSGEEIYELIGAKDFTAYYVKITKDGQVLESGLDTAGRRK